VNGTPDPLERHETMSTPGSMDARSSWPAGTRDAVWRAVRRYTWTDAWSSDRRGWNTATVVPGPMAPSTPVTTPTISYQRLPSSSGPWDIGCVGQRNSGHRTFAWPRGGPGASAASAPPASGPGAAPQATPDPGPHAVPPSSTPRRRTPSAAAGAPHAGPGPPPAPADPPPSLHGIGSPPPSAIPRRGARTTDAEPPGRPRGRVAPRARSAKGAPGRSGTEPTRCDQVRTAPTRCGRRTTRHF
jgi:hypothetical protein